MREGLELEMYAVGCLSVCKLIHLGLFVFVDVGSKDGRVGCETPYAF